MKSAEGSGPLVTDHIATDHRFAAGLMQKFGTERGGT